MDNFLVVVILLATIGVAVCSMWDIKTDTLTAECAKSGSFYVGSKVYECKLKESK